MRDRTRMRSPSFRSDNRKSKIENRKLAGLSVIAFVLVVCGAVATAQQPEKIRRIGLLAVNSPSADRHLDEAFKQRLSELGWVEGQNIAIEYRSAEGKADRLVDLAAELVRLKVDVIVSAGGTPGAQAAKKATGTIPIVFTSSGDPVATGLVTSLARPGGNVTGLSRVGPDLSVKKVELLKEIMPKISRVAFIWNPSSQRACAQRDGVSRAGSALATPIRRSTRSARI